MSQYRLFLEHSPQTEWAGQIFLLEQATGALGGGLFIGGVLSQNPVAAAIGFVLALGVKGLLLLADLGKPWRCLRVLTRPQASWISLGAWILGFFGLFGVIETGILIFGPPESQASFFMYAALLFAVIVVTYDGLVMSSARSVEAWGSGLLAPLFAVSALATGLITVSAWDLNPTLRLASFLFTAAELILLGCHISSLRGGGTGARNTAGILLSGEQKGVFLGLVLVGSVILPLILFAIPIGRPVLIITALLQILGLYGLRSSLIRSGVTTPVI